MSERTRLREQRAREFQTAVVPQTHTPPVAAPLLRMVTRRLTRADISSARGSKSLARVSEMVCWHNLVNAWGELRGFTPGLPARNEFSKHCRALREIHVIGKSYFPLLKSELTKAGVNPNDIMAGKPLREARTKPPSLPGVAKSTPPAPRAKTADDLAAEKFKEYATLKEGRNWTAICLFHKSNRPQIEAGRAVMLKELDAAITTAASEAKAEIQEYRTQVRDL